MDCQNLAFSPKQSQKRIEKALRVLPTIVLKKILFFALYLLGARLKTIASFVDIPEKSGKTTIQRVLKDGINAFSDRRQAVNNDVRLIPSSKTPQVFHTSVLSEDDYCIIISEDDYCIIIFGDTNHQLKIPLKNRVYLKSVLLSFLQANLVSIHTVSSVLGITPAHCRELANRLLHEDLTEVLVDKRKGQKKDFRVDQSVKSELIQQFAARAITGHSISSYELTELINHAYNTNISPRTIRWHMNKLGLMKIKKTLPELVETLKKKS
jgi:hypothetical protein